MTRSDWSEVAYMAWVAAEMVALWWVVAFVVIPWLQPMLERIS